MKPLRGKQAITMAVLITGVAAVLALSSCQSMDGARQDAGQSANYGVSEGAHTAEPQTATPPVSVSEAPTDSGMAPPMTKAALTVISGTDDPDKLHGVRTKWKSNSKDARDSIIPDLYGLTVAQFVKNLEDIGVNCADVNLEPRRKLLEKPKHEIGELTEQQIEHWEYTPEQRNQAIVDFLKEVKDAKEKGEIQGKLRFIVHQRLWPGTQKDKRKESEQEFIEDMSSFINLAKENHVDDLIYGIRLGENNIHDMNYELQFPLITAEAINAATDGWLKEKGSFMMGGGGNRGAYFKGIQNTPASKDFFKNMARFTASFAFSYKHFDQDKRGYMGKIMELEGYDRTKKEDWNKFLIDDYGLNDLRDFIDSGKDQYPNHANTVFVGDSSDSIKQMDAPAYEVLSELFSSYGSGFRGNVGMNGYKDEDKDDGAGLLGVVNGKVKLQRNTYAKWNSWPALPDHAG